MLSIAEENVVTHLEVKSAELKKLAEEETEAGYNQSCIQMYKDMATAYADCAAYIRLKSQNN